MKRRLTIVGLGPGSEDDLTLAAVKALESGDKIILRTDRHGASSFLRQRGIDFSSLDHLYENSDSFDDLYKAMIDHIVSSLEQADLVLGLPGHPLIGEQLALYLLKDLDRSLFDIKIIPGLSQAGQTLALAMQPVEDKLIVLDSMATRQSSLNPDMDTVITGLSSPIIASDLKLKLLEVYPADHRVFISQQASGGQVRVKDLSLEQIDRLGQYDHTTSLYMPSLELERLDSFRFHHLAQITERLRSKDGCPWDRAQDHNSLKQYLIEECYEVLEAIDLEDMDKLSEELGDLLFQVMFHSQIAKERGEFNIANVITGVSQKMIQRHPHIFADTKVKDADEVLVNWEAIKKEEKGLKSQSQVLKDIPSNLPALMRAYKVQKKASNVGFDWDHVGDAIEKVKEELDELLEVYKAGPVDKVNEELGDLLFATVNICRFFDIQPELCLTAATEKFISRFTYIEQMADKPLEDMTLDEMDLLWNRAKSTL